MSEDLDKTPAILCVDVEPDAVQVPHDRSASWEGVEDVIACIERLRAELGERTGATPCFGWYLRMDHQIATCEGQIDFVTSKYAREIERLLASGDVLGLHVHPLRWCDEREVWIHEFEDFAFVQDVIEGAFETFSRTFDEPARRHRFGAGYMSNNVLREIARHGARIDLTLEPGRRASSVTVPDTPVRGRFPNTMRIPRTRYRPSSADFRFEGTDGPGIELLPLTATSRRPDRSSVWHSARALRRGFRPPELALLPGRDWGGAVHYWNMVERCLRDSAGTHFATAVRTLSPESRPAHRMRAALEALPSHPLADRLRFVDPIH